MALNQISTCTNKGKTAEYIQIKYIYSDKFEIQEYFQGAKSSHNEFTCCILFRNCSYDVRRFSEQLKNETAREQTILAILPIMDPIFL